MSETLNNQTKLKIGQFIDTYYPNIDGVITVVNNYSKRLNITDTCTVFAPKASKKKNYTDNQPYDVVRCNSIAIPVVKLECALPNGDYNLKQEIYKRDLDIIHAHSPFNMGKYAIRMGKKLNIPVIGHFHTKYYDDFKTITKSEILAKLLLKNVMKFYDNVDEVWTVNNVSKETLKEYGFKGKIEIISNGTEYKYPDNPEELIAKAEEFVKIGKDETVLTFVGQLIYQKNLKLLLHSIKLLKDKGAKFRVVIVGTGYNEKALKELTTELGIDDCVTYTGRIADRNILAGIYLRSTLMLFPSLYDTSSMINFETAAHKLPCIFIRGASTAEAIIDNHNGFFAENTPESYCEKIFELINKKDFVNAVGENAYKEIYWSWDDVVKTAKEKYITLIDRYNHEKQFAKSKKFFTKA